MEKFRSRESELRLRRLTRKLATALLSNQQLVNHSRKQRWPPRFHSLPLYKNGAKISRIQAPPSGTDDIMWSQSLCSSELGAELRY